jgi:hypothetical protein
MSSSITFDNSLLLHIEDQLKQLSKNYVLVGIQEGVVTRQESIWVEYKDPEDRGADGHLHEKEGGLNMADIAAQNEFGTNKIPARPFIGPAIENNSSRILSLMRSDLSMLLQGKRTWDKIYVGLGKYVTDLMKTEIDNKDSPPLSNRTIKEKGFDKPLIDFGQMRNALNYRIAP